MTEITRQLAVAALLAALVAVSAVVAALIGRPAWAAALGAALVLVYWALELLAARRARGATPAGSVAVALGGMIARFAVVLGALIVVGLADASVVRRRGASPSWRSTPSTWSSA